MVGYPGCVFWYVTLHECYNGVDQNDRKLCITDTLLSFENMYSRMNFELPMMHNNENMTCQCMCQILSLLFSS